MRKISAADRLSLIANKPNQIEGARRGENKSQTLALTGEGLEGKEQQWGGDWELGGSRDTSGCGAQPHLLDVSSVSTVTTFVARAYNPEDKDHKGRPASARP